MTGRPAARRGRTRITTGGAALLVAFMALGPGIATVNAYTPTPVPTPGHIRPVVRPIAVSDRLVTVVVELSGDPLAVVQAGRRGVPLTVGEQGAIDAALAGAQAPIASRIKAMGGRVLASYRAAYNGLKVLVKARQLARLAAVPGVLAIHPLQQARRDALPVPAALSPAVWAGLAGLSGDGIKVAVIDTGIDYTHANFSGPGTTEAFDAAKATDTQPADPSLFGPNAPRVKGGIDLVGDDYDTDETSDHFQPIPHPDPNPLDCDGHGSHVAGILGGSGVLANGKTYSGPYTPAAIASRSWTILPGVAPRVDLYSVRVFGCFGSSEAIIDGIDWAVAHRMQVINMSLGGSFGTSDDPTAVAADNAARAGIIVVASSGNSGSSPYLTSEPASGNGVISVAATDGNRVFPAAKIAFAGGTTMDAINANGMDIAAGSSFVVKVIADDPATEDDESLGCSPEAFGAVDAHTIAIVKRGVCARVSKAIFGEQAGAGAVVMVNTSAGLPPYEGQITSNPDTGEPFTVTIPFLGVEGPASDPTSDGAVLLGANGTSVTVSPTTVDNPTALDTADFSSAGPRSGDSALKPDVAAPGVSITSTGSGTGNGPAIESGTSMSSPFVAGIAALVRQADPAWKDTALWRAAIANTANPALVANYSVSVAGSGLVQVGPATQTHVVAQGPGSVPALNFGFAELSGDFVRSINLNVRNLGSTPVTFAVSAANKSGSPHSVAVARTLTVPAGASRSLRVTLTVPAGTAGDSSTFNEVGGLVSLKPRSGQNNGVTLRVPYYFVPQTVSHISTILDLPPPGQFGTATVTNTGRGPGAAEFFAWGLVGSNTPGLGSDDLRAAGAAYFPGDRVLVFAISTFQRWSNPTENEIDVFVDVDGDGTDDYVVSALDIGAVLTGTENGELGVIVTNIATGDTSVELDPDAPFNSSTMELPVFLSQLCEPGQACVSASRPIAYHVASFGLLDATTDTLPGTASFSVYAPPISSGMVDVLEPGQSSSEPIELNPAAWNTSPPLGLMIRTADNVGSVEAQLIPIQR